MGVATAPRRHAGRYDARLSNEELLPVIGDVLRYARPDAPLKVTTRVFDKAREGAGHLEDCPTARAVVMRFNKNAKKAITWEQIRELAINPNRSATQTLAAAEREPAGD